jgi:Leucine-rich repeat (LRR) protein
MKHINEYLESLSYDVKYINLCGNNLIDIPDLSRFTKVTTLYCNNNKLKELKNLPSTLKTLNCSNNQLTELKDLPNILEDLVCCNNQLIKIKDLPSTLYYLDCSDNQLTKL